MQRPEFEKRTGEYPDSIKYDCIEREYERQTEDGHDVWKGKDEFCAAYKENRDGLAQKIQQAADNDIWRIEENYRKAMTENNALVQQLQGRIAKLEKALDKELEWEPDENAGTNLAQYNYKELLDSTTTEKLSDEKAVTLVSEMFGFMPERIEIIHDISTFERNRHGRLRVRETFTRDPLYASTDWNYVRFNCAGCQWEMIDGGLTAYED